MTLLRSLLPKLAVFAVSMLIGAVVANAVVAATSDRTPVSSASAAPEYMLAGADTPAGPGPVVAFNEEPDPSQAPIALATLAPVDLDAAAAALLGGAPGGQGTEPAAFTDPTGFPRIDPITQFDGGPFQGANCTLASGSMLARLAFGIVTNGSVLRTLQDDQDGGTGLNDLSKALWRGYGVSAPTGLLRPQQLKDLLASGYGAVIQGLYGEIPTGLRLQRNFTGGHAIYLDGYYPGNAKRGIPEAYYVIDPLGRPKAGYKGEWWPASIVDSFAVAFGGGRIPAMWAFPPGGVPPEVVGPDVVPIPDDPPGPDTPNPSAEPVPTASAEVPASPSASPAVPPVGPVLEPGDLTLDLPAVPDPPVDGAGLGGLIVVPVFDFCLVNPGFSGCPSGLEAVFQAGEPPILQLPKGPDVEVVFVDSDRANQVIVGFTVDPPATADVKFWVQGESPGSVGHASAMSTIDLLGSTIILARLDVRASTTYAFQAVGGNGFFAGTSEVGTFTTGSGVERFDVALAQEAAPVFKAGSGLSPYSHLAEAAFRRPMIKLEALGGSSCDESADFGGTGYCLDQVDLGPISNTCTVAKVAYELAGIEAESVAVRAHPAEAGVTPDGALTLDGVLEANGPAGTGDVSVGCLGSGMTYHIVIDAIGDDRGALASETVIVP
ncbi:MAG TPA: hypothetical protein VES19_12300 [Candidatus Limnocylindrales bacterium]|nr:hypothetical protein [Candidatus Limnocylindrales bacterium]